MKFRAYQYVSGYLYFEFEAKNRPEAEKMVKGNNEGELPLDKDGNELEFDQVFKQVNFEIDDGGDLHLCDN